MIFKMLDHFKRMFKVFNHRIKSDWTIIFKMLDHIKRMFKVFKHRIKSDWTMIFKMLNFKVELRCLTSFF